jgi:hypothetical protein
MNLFRDLTALSIGAGFAWREYITIVKTNPNSGMAIGMMYAAQKMRERTIFSTPAPSPRVKNNIPVAVS